MRRILVALAVGTAATIGAASASSSAADKPQAAAVETAATSASAPALILAPEAIAPTAQPIPMKKGFMFPPKAGDKAVRRDPPKKGPPLPSASTPAPSVTLLSFAPGEAGGGADPIIAHKWRAMEALK
ncbi:MAG: hypothetical protein AAGC56_01565, partial [Pseudomonadota bacterium]